jgi:hypothetical protein
VKFGFEEAPGFARLHSARRLADSLLAAHQNPDEHAARYLAPVAAILGRAGESARLAGVGARRASYRIGGRTVPWTLEMARAAERYRVFATLGPTDSIRVSERAVRRNLERLPRGWSTTISEQLTLGQSGRLAFIHSGQLPSLQEAPRDPLWIAASASVRGDRSVAVAALAQIRTARVGLPTAETAGDARLVEAAVMARLGDTTGARRWLEEWLAAASDIVRRPDADVAATASLLEAIALTEQLRPRIAGVPQRSDPRLIALRGP